MASLGGIRDVVPHVTLPAEFQMGQFMSAKKRYQVNARPNGADSESRIHDRIVERRMNRSLSRDAREVKLLLLGTGESGKSTLFKQTTQIYGPGFDAMDLEVYTRSIRDNMIEAMQALCFSSMQLRGGYSVQTDAAQVARDFFCDLCLERTVWLPRSQERGRVAVSTPTLTPTSTSTRSATASPQYSQSEEEDEDTGIFCLLDLTWVHMRVLWDDPGIQHTWSHRATLQIPDTSARFFDSLEHISNHNYVPTTDDILNCRIRTTGICETRFQVDNTKFLMLDVGGQRSERKKWIHCFAHVTALVFVSAISEYDEVCYEDNKTNRVMESLMLFDEICNGEWFGQTPVILFLNKRDLFAEKIQKKGLDCLFPEYTGGKDYTAALKFLSHKFTELDRREGGTLHIHVTCATDGEAMGTTFGVVHHTILQTNLLAVGMN